MGRNEVGYTLAELIVVIVVLAIISTSAITLYAAVVRSAVVAKRQAAASTLATNQMEYLKSLPYDSLAIAGGPIVANSYLPASLTTTIDGDTFKVTTTISYVDDAYDGCGSYPTQVLKQKYCVNYPSPSNAPALDTNPADYKDVHVSVTDSSNLTLAQLDTHIAALVSETASNTGALFVNVVDNSGNPVVGATVSVTNSSVSPAVNVTDTTDQNGYVIFYDLPPSTTGYTYNISASATGYSSLTTIPPNGSLQPTYSNQNLIAQSSSYATLTLEPQGQNSLVIETTDTSGNPLPNAKIYLKGGYKKYTGTSDTSYYYDTLTPSDTRPGTDSNGFAGLTNLVPGTYIFCGDTGATSCSVGGTTYYLAAAVPYGGVNPLQPITVPTYSSGTPPSTTFPYNGVNYLQKVRLLLTTNRNFPRVAVMTPYDVSLSGGSISNFSFSLTGANLPCSSSSSSCSTHISLVQGSNTYTASCTGSNSGLQLNCTVNLSGATIGDTQLVVTVGSYTLTLPASPLLGGIIVTQ